MLKRADLIVISTDVRQLTGVGLEYLTDLDGNVLATFWNGDLRSAHIARNSDSEPTQIPAIGG